MKKIGYSKVFTIIFGLLSVAFFLSTAHEVVAEQAFSQSPHLLGLAAPQKKALTVKLATFPIFPTFPTLSSLPTSTEWENIAPGLDVITLEGTVERLLPRPDGGESLPGSLGTTAKQSLSIVALRIDPKKYSFQLYSSALEKSAPQTATVWAETKNLVAAINASMYKPDGSSTGYMRQGENVLNKHVAKRYGSFFVANTQNPNLLPVDILDKNSANWQSLLPHYAVVVQNFRLFGPNKENLWPMDGPEHAVAAVGVDEENLVYFLHCPSSVSVYNFITVLLKQPPQILKLRAAMYVEGGTQAALVVNSGESKHTWLGAHPADLFIDQTLRESPLPNVLGVLKK